MMIWVKKAREGSGSCERQDGIGGSDCTVVCLIVGGRGGFPQTRHILL